MSYLFPLSYFSFYSFLWINPNRRRKYNNSTISV